jgi:two-component system OmpR family response regulator
MTIAITTAAQDGLRQHDERPPRVLVVDDEPSLADLLTLAFEYEGWDVRAAANGAEALRLADEFRPDAVLLDMMLPDIDGIEVVRRLRAAASDVPVLFLSARDDVEDRAAGLNAGAQGYLTKPFSLDDVIGGVRALMG